MFTKKSLLLICLATLFVGAFADDITTLIIPFKETTDITNEITNEVVTREPTETVSGVDDGVIIENETESIVYESSTTTDSLEECIIDVLNRLSRL